MKKILKLTESDLTRLILRVIKEENEASIEFDGDAGEFGEFISNLDYIANLVNDETDIEELEYIISEIESELSEVLKSESLSDNEIDDVINYGQYLMNQLIDDFEYRDFDQDEINESLYQDRYGSVQSINYSKEFINEAEYQGRKVQLGKVMQGDVKKSKVYVKNDKGRVVKVNFGFGGSSAKGKRMTIKKNDPARRKAFRARHNCENPGPRWKPRYWSCKAW
jgi:hypothetical protein